MLTAEEFYRDHQTSLQSKIREYNSSGISWFDAAGDFLEGLGYHASYIHESAKFGNRKDDFGGVVVLMKKELTGRLVEDALNVEAAFCIDERTNRVEIMEGRNPLLLRNWNQIHSDISLIMM